VSHFIQDLYHKIRYSDPPRLLFDLLSKFHISIFPFNLYCFIIETEISFPPSPPELREYHCELLGRESLESLAAVPRKGDMRKEFGKRFAAGENCFGILKEDEIAGYCWFNRKECTSTVYNFALDSELEIYLYDVYVVPKYRGRGICPYLITQFYPWLQSKGINKVYATISLFNNPSNGLTVNYRQETLVKMLYVSIFDIYERTFLLKRYKTQQ
jgi:GNAT superfamily N-acetyltransferase